MERFVVREPRVGSDYPQGNQMISFSTNTGNPRNMIPETMYFGGYGAEFPAAQPQGFMGMTHVNAPTFAPNLAAPNQVMSGIDSRYLAGYADENAAFIAGQRYQMGREQNAQNSHTNGPTFASDYENRNFMGPDRRLKTFTSQMGATSTANMSIPSASPVQDSTPSRNIYTNAKQMENRQSLNTSASSVQESTTSRKINTTAKQADNRQSFNISTPMPTPSPSGPKTTTNKADSQKSPAESTVKTRNDILKELYKSGIRAFSGPVEKVLKWHKSLQDIGVMVLYEIVGKCVSVRPGERSAKTLVVRDDNGPAIQVVYYEIDFLLPELKPPCTVRVVGRMMPGTSRLQAFSVRCAAGDDVATLPRRAAIAAHHVAKLCKEYGHVHNK